MATVTVTSTPTTLDATGAAELGVTNTGGVSVFVNSQRVRPQQRLVFDTSQPLVVVTQGGSATSTVSTDIASPTRASAGASGVGAFEAMVPAASRTYVSKTGVGNQSNGTDTGMNTQSKHTALASTIGLQVAYANIYNNGTQAALNTNDITVRAAVTKDFTTYYAVWFNGRRDAVIEPGGIVFGEVGVSLTAGEVFYTRTYVTVAAGGRWPLSAGDLLNGTDEGSTSGTTQTDLTTTGTITANTTPGFIPAGFFGKSTAQRAVAVLGDSIVAGRGDAEFYSGGGGWPVRALGTSLPWLRPIAFSGTAAFFWGGWSARGNTAQRRLLQHVRCTSVISGLGVNDVTTAGINLSGVQIRLQEAWRQARASGAKVYQTTITPVTTSTDAWATTTGQTPHANEAVRAAVNDWIRSRPAGLDGVIELADAVEPTRNAGIWRAAMSVDGTHPNAAGSAALAAAVNVSILA